MCTLPACEHVVKPKLFNSINENLNCDQQSNAYDRHRNDNECEMEHISSH